MNKDNFNYLEEVLQENQSPSSRLGVEEHKTRLCIDFDGVIHKYSKGYANGTIYDGPMEGVEDALLYLKSKGFSLVCFSARINAGDTHGKKEMIDWLKKYNLMKYFDDITDQKIPCIAYIDDNAIRHTDWSSTLKKFEIHDIL